MFKAFLYIPDISRYLGCWSVAIYQREGKYHFGWVTVRLYSTAHLQYQQHPKPLSPRAVGIDMVEALSIGLTMTPHDR